MSLIRESPNCGFVRRLIHVYREKRQPQPVKEYVGYRWLRDSVRLANPEMRLVHRRMPRRAAWQIAWRQAANAREVERGV